MVLIVKSAGNTLFSTPQEQDFSQQIETSHRSITAILDPLQSGINPTLYLDKKPHHKWDQHRMH